MVEFLVYLVLQKSVLRYWQNSVGLEGFLVLSFHMLVYLPESLELAPSPILNYKVI